MFDISFGELAVIGVVALVVIGPEKLPKVARTVGALVGRAQRYVHDVKADIQREVNLGELKQLQSEMHDAAQSLRNTVQFVIGYVPGTLVASLLIAFLLSLKIRFHKVYRAIFFFPTVISIIVISEVWLWIYEPKYGLLNYYLGKLGLPNNIAWLGDPTLAMWSIVLMSIWALSPLLPIWAE